MNLAKKCKEGTIKTDEFFEFAAWQRPRRTHLLNVGDYVVLSDIFQEDKLVIEKIAQLDYLEAGDFLTDKGTTGPISGNVFIKVDRKLISHRGTTLIEGDRLNYGPGSVYYSINKYLENRCRQN